MRRTILRLFSLLAIAVGAQFARPVPLAAFTPQCAENAASMCNPPANYVTCSASCTQNSTGYLLTCTYQPFQCAEQ